MFSFKDTFAERLRLIRADAGNRSNLVTQEQFSRLLENICNDTAGLSYDLYEQDSTKEEHMKKALEHSKNSVLKGHEVCRTYNKMWFLYHNFMNGKDEDLRLDRIDRDRYIGYRLATTIGIAFIIFVLYWIAGCMGINLPAMRL